MINYSEKLGQQYQPRESDIKDHGVALHDHNGFSTPNLESLSKWNNKPSLTIVSKSIYSGFSPESIDGLSKLTKIVVIHEVDTFLDGDGNLSKEFQSNLSIMGKVLEKEKRADELRSNIDGLFKDIHSLIEGKTPKYDKAYIGGASNSGSKSLRFSVGSYLPFQIAGIMNSYNTNSTTAVDIGNEGLSSCIPDVLFFDLSGTNKFESDDSKAVLKYAESNNLPIYTLLPYFWFGYNFDNAIANAYYLIYVCYDDVLTYEQCMGKISSTYEAFMPNASELKDGDSHGGAVVLDNFNDYYGKTGSKLTMDGKQYVSKSGKIEPA